MPFLPKKTSRRGWNFRKNRSETTSPVVNNTTEETLNCLETTSQAMDKEAEGYKMHHLVRNSNTGLLELHEELTEEILKNGSIIRSSWSRESLVEHKKELELNQEIKSEPPQEMEPQITQTYAQDDLLTEPYIKEEVVVDEESLFDAIPKEETIEQDPLEITSTSENFDKNKTLLSLSKFLKPKNSHKKITMDELEQFCIEKKCKVIVCKNDRNKLGFVSNHLKMQQQIIKTMDKRINQISKKVEQLQQGPFRLDINESIRTLPDVPTSQESDKEKDVSADNETKEKKKIGRKSNRFNNSKPNGEPRKGKKTSSFCLFCEHHVLNFSRHLQRNHSDEPDVQKILLLSCKSTERKKLLTLLRNKGNYLISKTTKKPVRKPIINQELLPCTNCLGFFSSKQLWRHRKKCIIKIELTINKKN